MNNKQLFTKKDNISEAERQGTYGLALQELFTDYAMTPCDIIGCLGKAFKEIL